MARGRFRKPRKRIILGTVVLGVIVAAGIFLSENVLRSNAERPAPRVSALEPLPRQISRVTVPVSVPIEAVEKILERRTPKQERGSMENSLGRPFIQSKISWDISRSALRVSGQNGAITVATRLSGETRASGTLRHIRKADFSSEGEIIADTSITTHPALKENWRVSPDFSEMEIDIKRAEIPVDPIGKLDVRDQILPGIEIALRGLRAQLDRSVARNDFFQRAAKKGWTRLCGSTELGKDSGLWLETKPLAARAAQVRVNSEEIRFVFGVDLETRILPEPTSPRCPFPEMLLIEEAGPGGFEVLIPAEISYETLERRLAEQIAGKSLGKNVSIVIKEVEIHPYGEMLLLETTVAVETNSLSGMGTRGTLYLLAEPRLNAAAQTVALENVEIETDSQNLLFSIAGKAAEPLLAEAISRRLPLDLGPKLKELQGEAETALSALSSDEVSVSGKVNRVRLTRLDVGPQHLRLVLSAKGRMSAVVRAAP